jgi:ABC-2 type transport system permease protein
MLMALLLTALTVVRERELGTLEQLLVSPLSPAELILGKTLPVAIIAFVDLLLVTAVAILWFGIPFRGSFLALLVAAFIYIIAGLSFGLLISTFARTQQEALMTMFLFLLPAIILSGFMFPIFTMPPVFQWLTLLNPIRHFLEVVRPVFLKGAGIGELWPQYLWLLGLAGAGLAAARVRFGVRE